MTTENAAENTAQTESTETNESQANQNQAAEQTTEQTNEETKNIGEGQNDENLTEEELAEKAAKKAEDDEANRKQASERTRRRREQRRNAKNRRETEARITAEKEAAYWRGRAESQPRTEQDEADGKPNADDFDTFEDYVDKLTDWKLDQAAKGKPIDNKPVQETGADNNRPATVGDQKTRETFNNKGFEKYGEDFVEMMDAAANVEFVSTEEMADYMLHEETGIDVAMHLYDNPEEAAKIANLSPRAQIRALDKLSESLATGSTDTGATEHKEPVGKTISQAPEPINRERGKNIASGDTAAKAAARGDMEAYSRLREKERRASG